MFELEHRAPPKLKCPTETELAVEYPPDSIPAVGVPGVIPDAGGSSLHQQVDGKTAEVSNSEATAIGEFGDPPVAVVPRTKKG